MPRGPEYPVYDPNHGWVSHSDLNEEDWTVANSDDLVEPTDLELGELERNLEEEQTLDDDRLFDLDSITSKYLREIGEIPLLTPHEEVALFKRKEAGRNAGSELLKGPVSRKRRAQNMALAKDGNEAVDHLVRANIRLVIPIAKKRCGRGVSFADLIQEGNVGLIRGIAKFDYRRGFRVSTYVTWWIRQSVMRAVHRHGRTIRLPIHVGEDISKLYRTEHELAQRLGRDPSPKEIAQELGLTVEKVEKRYQYSRFILSLNTPVGEDEEYELGDFIEDQNLPTPYELEERIAASQYLREVLPSLLPREQKILRLRYGLDDGKDHSLEEVGRELSLTRERIRQLEKEALEKLREIKPYTSSLLDFPEE